ncbi:MAG: 16S rRNA (uracil(1498)-N(3))-methyltransferase [Cyanobacteria bacterium J06641_5]
MLRELSHKIQRVTIATAQLHKESITLSTEQKHYLLRVLRLQAKDRFVATTGNGRAWLAQLNESGTAQVVEEIEQRSELPVAITAIVALPKGGGFEDILRAGTELGASAFVPIIAARTLLKPNTNKLERWRRIATEAAEQSERGITPQVSAPMAFREAIAAPQLHIPEAQLFICVARQDTPHLGQVAQTTGPIAIATGCEGGWTEAELEAAIATGFKPVTLGRRILRAVTAPIAALAVLAAVLEGEGRTD